MKKNNQSLKNFATPNQGQIQSFLLKGFSPSDLTDSRIFNPPFNSQEVFSAIINLSYLSKEGVLN